MVCLWETDSSCCQETWDGASPALQARAADYATTVLWSLTGRRFGPCAMTVRPCTPRIENSYQTYGVWLDAVGGGNLIPYIWDGTWRNCGCGYGACACEPASQVWLPGPVAAISEVRINNEVLLASAYRVDNGQWLVRQDGGVFPEIQDMGNPASSTSNTFVVTYLRGEMVPDGGAAAAGSLACEYIRACQGGPCRFPKRVTSVSRQGVTVSANETIAHGETGIPEVDGWIRAMNPGKLTQRPLAYNADLPSPRVTTWSG